MEDNITDTFSYQLESLTAQSQAAQNASRASPFQVEVSEHTSRDSVLEASEKAHARL